MSGKITIKREGNRKWIHMEGFEKPEGIEKRCTVENLQNELSKRIKGITVISAEVNTSGKIQAPDIPYFPLKEPFVREGIPDICDVRIEHTMPSGRVQSVLITVPLIWNERFLGLTGGGNKCDPPWSDYPAPVFEPTMNVVTGLQNGFAIGSTDGANTGTDIANSALDPTTLEVDRELIRNWSHLSMYWVSVIGKAVVEILQGAPPLYSYIYGSSGGGYQVPVLAQKAPWVYDGYYALGGPLDYIKTCLLTLWPVLVMKEYDNVLPPSKLETFRQAAIASIGGTEAYANRTERIEFNAFDVVGANSPSGTITYADAKVQQMIWDGPAAKDGRRLSVGFRPGSSNVLIDGPRPGIIFYSHEADGAFDAAAAMGLGSEEKTTAGTTIHANPGIPITLCTVGAWALHKYNWDWNTLTMDAYLELFETALKEYDEFSGVNPDLTMLRDTGGKMIYTQGAADEMLISELCLPWYENVVKFFGNKEEVKKFFRFLLTPGMGHTFPSQGYGPCTAEGMAALMNWVENDIAPETMSCDRFRDPAPPENPDDLIGQFVPVDWQYVGSKDVPFL